MDEATPARLYATLVGALLVIAGIIGFFYSASFGSPGTTEDVFGLLSVNAWHNVFHIATGAIGLLVAGFAARRYALLLGLLYLAVAAWGFVIGSGNAILGVIPINAADTILHLALGALGVLAYLATPRPTARASVSRKPQGPSLTA
jgi:Domain of unknown function (DUF4383)